MVKHWQRVLVSLILTALSFSCFVFMPPTRSDSVSRAITISPSELRTEVSSAESAGVSRLLEWIGLGALIIAVWLWRRELGVTTLGPLGAAVQVDQQEAGGALLAADAADAAPTLDLTALTGEMVDAERKRRLEHIMQMFRQTRALSVQRVAKDLGVSPEEAKTYLFYLTKIGHLRADGFPRNTIYTPSKSLENRILDAVKRMLVQEYGVLTERRFVRVGGHYDVDALLESEDLTIVVETKTLAAGDIAPRLECWIPQVVSAALKLHGRRVAGVLAIACLQDALVADLKAQIAAYTFDTGPIAVQVLVFSQSDLDGA